MTTRLTVAIVLLGTILSALPLEADKLKRKRFGRRFPSPGWCPMQNDLDGTQYGFEFTTGSKFAPVTIRFVAEAWGDSEGGTQWSEPRIDNIMVFKKYDMFEQDFHLFQQSTLGRDCNGHDPGVFEVQSYRFDPTNARQGGYVRFDETFNQNPKRYWSGIWTGDGSISECNEFTCDTAPLPIYWLKDDSVDEAGNPSNGVGSLGFGRDKDSANLDEARRFVGASITLRNLKPNTEYVLVGWWSAETQSSMVTIDISTNSVTLLVDDDNDDPDVAPYYEEALQLLGLRPIPFGLGSSYDVFETFPGQSGPYVEPPLQCAQPGDTCLEDYDTVIWFSGDKHDSTRAAMGPAGPSSTAEADLAGFPRYRDLPRDRQSGLPSRSRRHGQHLHAERARCAVRR